MTQITIPAHVVNGHLQHEMSLAELEGQHVLATLTIVPASSTNGNHAPAQVPTIEADLDPEPPEWLDIENDVYFPITVPETRLPIKTLIVERGKPSIILPEDLPDE